MSDNLLEICGLSVHYPGRAAWFFQKAAPKKAAPKAASKAAPKAAAKKKSVAKKPAAAPAAAVKTVLSPAAAWPFPTGVRP